MLDLVETAADSTLRTLITDVALVATDWSAARPRIEAEHRGILDALAGGTPDRAGQLVTDHIRYWGGSIAARLEPSTPDASVRTARLAQTRAPRLGG